MKLGSSRGMDTKRPRGSERRKPRHELQLTRRSQPPYPWPPEQAQPGVSKPCRTTRRGFMVDDWSCQFGVLSLNVSWQIPEAGKRIGNVILRERSSQGLQIGR